MKKPSILFINRIYPPHRGASGRILREVAKSFARRGWDITILTNDPKAKRQKDGAIYIVRAPGLSFKRTLFSTFFEWLCLLIRGIFTKKHDYIVTMTDPPMVILIGQLLSKLKKSKHVHWCHDLYPDLLPVLGVKTPHFLFSFLKKMNRQALQSCERVIVIGRCMAGKIRQYGIDGQKITFIPNWANIELFKTTRTKPDTALKDLEKKDKEKPLIKDETMKFRVLYAGTIGRAHPIEPILKAAEKLSKTNPEIEFVFIGDSDSHAALAEDRNKRGLENVKFLPFQPARKLKELMRSGDIHLATMRHEAMGMLVPCKIYSAFGAGRPIIFLGPEDSEAAITIKEYNAGKVINAEDPDILAKTVLDYRMDSETWFESKQGAELAGRTFLPDESIKAFIARIHET